METKKFLSVLLLLVACNTYANFDDEKTLFIVGSTSVAKLIEITENEFQKQTGIRILMRALGSDKGTISQAKGLSDLAVISRYLTKEEQKTWPLLTQFTFAQDAIVFIANKNNQETSLTKQQIQKIYTNNSPLWPNSNQLVNVTSKKIGHGTHDSFLAFFDLESMNLPTLTNDKAKILFKNKGGETLFSKNSINTYSKINQAIGLIFRIENAIAYESLGAYQVFIEQQEFVNTKLLSLDGIPPLINDEVNQRYPFKRSFNIIASQSRTKNAQAYIDFILSTKGQKLLAENGFISLPQ